MAVGQPAEPHSVNSEGLKRRGFTEGEVRNIKHAYRLLYRSGLKLKDALLQLEEFASDKPELAVFIDFIRTSSRSIVR
jgi:UDP-N-acetylglucosamine acyltransferase